MKKKLTILTISIPYKRAGNVIHQQAVSFEVYRLKDHYYLIPLLNANELEVANLPQSLNFVIEDGRPVSLRGKIDGNFHVIAEAAQKLIEQGLLV